MEFSGAQFSGQAGFHGALFSDEARFDGAHFSSEAGFNAARFSGNAHFHARFSRRSVPKSTVRQCLSTTTPRDCSCTRARAMES
ncbi:pentapeptide repeat-containing protein [Streptomyces sp. NPDC005480]|uniref:pentapeptide repeat-containing protein n=1 Tax=Streptomyces sp. NPDC005480 TaxID=3154880 RepID=UPI0033A38DD9